MEPPPVNYTTTSDGVSIAWSQYGEGPPLLDCAGTPFSHVQEQVEVFGEGFEAFYRLLRVVTFDARGCGMSEREVARVSAETLLVDAQAVIDATKLDRFAILADGGNLLALSTCLRLAIAHPERVTHLILESPYQNRQEVADTPYGRTGAALAELDWDVYTQTVARVLLGWDTATSDMIEPFAKAVGGWVDASVGVQYVREIEALDVSDLLAQVRQPTLVIRNDPYFVPARCCQRVAAKIPGAQFRQYSDPTYVQSAELIREFVDRSPSPLAQEAPSTLRVVLFTDLASSTALTQRLGDAKAQELVRAHNAIVREALRSQGGTEIKHTGDGIMASFPSASGGLECAVAILRGVEAHGDPNLAVHVGLNAGEPVADEGDLFGTAVQLARRICDQASGGEILASDVVRQLAAGKGFLFADRGEVVPKGFDEAVRLYEVRWREEEA